MPLGATRVLRVVLPLVSVFACGEPTETLERRTESEPSRAEPNSEPRESEPTSTADDADDPQVALAEPCDAPVPIYRGGAHDGEVCPAAAARRGLTVVNLSDDWAPFIFSEDASLGEAGEQPYRDVYLALADERLDDVPDTLDKELNVELFGITPTFRVLRERLADEERHACHAGVDTAGIDALSYTLRPWTPEREVQQERIRTVRYLRHRLGRAAEELGLTEVSALEGHPEWGAHYTRMTRLGTVVDAIVATQARLRCDGFITRRIRAEDGVFDWRTAGALAKYQRRHLIVSGGALDEVTRAALGGDSRAHDHAAVLRALRERVVDATGLLEDGSASRAWQDVLGQPLDAPEFRFEAGQPAAENAAPDLISPATEAAANALGWIDAASTLERLEAMHEAGHERVAVELPALPSYHSSRMELRAEVDRGDVYYRYPYDESGRRRFNRIERRPVLTLYARDGERDVALVRWPTTIGGWKPERLPGGGTGLKYKESFVGERVWRDVIASPAWLPPTSTPDDDLLRRVNRRLVPNYGLFGPGYRSAYGLVMLMHHKVLDPLDPDADPESPEAQPRFYDQGIRAHGSVSYRSITSGTSHGCHRLYNHLAVRLASFVLAHREFERHGSIDVRYQRNVRGIRFRIRSRGYRFELTPPVRMTVLEGRVRGGVDAPIRGYRRLREDLVREVEAEAAEDG